jgi:polyisoprenoid-binding protein YceI
LGRNEQVEVEMMHRFIAGAALGVIVAASGAAAEDIYSLDPVHSQPIFEVKHMGFSIQRGSFGKATGKVTLDRAARKGTIDVTIDTTSIKTIDPRLDAHVKGEDFFNVAKYPTMVYRSSNLIFDGERVVGAEGELTMLGVTRPVALKVANFVCGDHPMNRKGMCGAEVTATIKRSEWGMNYGIPKAVGDDVRIIVPVEAYKE